MLRFGPPGDPHAGKNVMQHSAEGMKGALWQPQWRLNASEWNQLLAALATALVLVLPICLNVPLYQDDFERAVNGLSLIHI